MHEYLFTPGDHRSRITESPFITWDSVTDDGGPMVESTLFTGLGIVGPYGLYLDRIDSGRCIFCHKGISYAFCTVVTGGKSPIYSIESGSVVGTCLFGYADSYSPNSVYVPASTTYIAPVNILPLITSRLLSLRDRSGNYATGDIVLYGARGVVVSPTDAGPEISCMEELRHVDGNDNMVPLTRIRFSSKKGSGIQIAANVTGGINLEYMGRTLSEMCDGSNSGKLPDSEGNLPTPRERFEKTPEGEPDKGSPSSGSYILKAEESDGNILLTSMVGGGVSRLSVSSDGDGTVILKLVG